MGDEYRNHGPVTKSETMRDVTNNSYHARELIINQRVATSTFDTPRIVPPTVQPRNISFKSVPEPHGAFIGRVAYVKSAVKYLSHPITTDVQIKFPCLVIHALGGYGKTQTARKIASNCRKTRKFQHFIWIDSEDDLSIKKCFAEVMEQIGLHSSDEIAATNFDPIMFQIYNILANREKEKFLIIFDNVEDFDNIVKYLPLNQRSSNFAVLMTSQRPFTRESYGHVRNQRLDLMPEDEAIQLVENILGTSGMDSEEDKKLLVERSGRITLVLCVMVSTIKFQRRSKSDYRLKDYLKAMNDQPIQYSDESNTLDLTYEKSLQKIVRFAVNKLNAIGGPIERIAVKMFDRLAYCSSTNVLFAHFVHRYFQDICAEANVDFKSLPMKPVDVMQIIRMAIEKLSEFSLAQIDGHEFTVHRWMQASRRLDLKDSGDERTVLKELLFIMSDVRYDPENTSIVWQHVADYADLVNEFYAKKKTLLEFPIFNVDVLEKIIRGLSQTADFEPFQNYSKEIEHIIYNQIRHNSLDAVQRTVIVSNYDVREKSTELISIAVSINNLNLVKWLVNEMSCIPEKDHLCCCFDSIEVIYMTYYLNKLKEFYVQTNERNLEKNLLERAFNKLKSLRRPSTSPRIVNLEITYLLSSLSDSEPLKIALCKIIEKNCGKNLLERILYSEQKNVESDAIVNCSECIKRFGIIRIILNSWTNLEPNIELNELKEKYSINNLLECLFICGPKHCYINDHSVKRECDRNLYRATYENNFTSFRSTDPTLTDFKDKCGRTPLMIAVGAGACKDTTTLLEKYSADVNALDIFDRTPLTYAIENSCPSILKTLLSHGAKTHWLTESGESVHALHTALECSYYDSPEIEEIIDAVLTSKDCDVFARDHVGNNILHLLVRDYYATRYRPKHRVLQLVLSTNAALINMQNNDGLTPLQLAKNLQAKFSGDHWHVVSLQTFISQLDKICQ